MGKKQQNRTGRKTNRGGILIGAIIVIVLLVATVAPAIATASRCAQLETTHTRMSGYVPLLYKGHYEGSITFRDGLIIVMTRGGNQYPAFSMRLNEGDTADVIIVVLTDWGGNGMTEVKGEVCGGNFYYAPIPELQVYQG